MTEQLHFHFSLFCIGEGKGNPLQCSCLENPRDGGAWLAAVYGVAQSQTQLKRLNSSSSRLVITFLPRSKCLLISWLQSPSAVILLPKLDLITFSRNPILSFLSCFFSSPPFIQVPKQETLKAASTLLSLSLIFSHMIGEKPY